MSRLPLALKIFLSLIVGVCLILSRMDSIWSGSPDLAHHYALVARIAEHWFLPATFDQTLGEMNFYPRYSHIAAALVGSLFGSPLIGLQLVSLIAVLILWAGFIAILVSLPRHLSLPSALFFVGALCLNKLFLHANLLFHGSEIVDNFFFSQLVAQSLAVLLLAMTLGIERSGWTPVKRNLVLAVCILPMTEVHLLPTLEILGVLVGLVMLDFMVIEGTERRSWKKFLIGMLIVIGATLGVVLNPDFAVMKDIATNNGGLALPYFQKVGRFGWLAAFVMAFSSALIFVWWKTEDRDKWDYMPIKYIGLYGVSVGLLCILQFVALRFGLGSEYAVKKYVFGIETILLLEIVIFAALVFRSLFRKWLDSR